jgi:hypothetical protein
MLQNIADLEPSNQGNNIAWFSTSQAYLLCRSLQVQVKDVNISLKSTSELRKFVWWEPQ